MNGLFNSSDLILLQREKAEYIYSELVTLAQKAQLAQENDLSNRLLALVDILGKEIDSNE